MSKMIQVYVIGLNGETYTIDIGESEEDFKRMTVLSFKKKVLEISQIEVRDTGDLRMLFVNEQLEDKKKLAGYGIKDRSYILAVMDMVGGGECTASEILTCETFVSSISRVLDFRDSRSGREQAAETFGHIGDDDLSVLRVEMSCRHAVDPTSLTGWCRSLIDSGHFTFHCPGKKDGTEEKCNKEWPYVEVRRHALLDNDEQKYFEEKVALLAAAKYCEISTRRENRAVDGPGAAMSKRIQVYVNDLKGKTYTINIGESEDDFKRMTVLSLKKKVIAKLLPEVRGTDDLRLLFGSDQLEDNKTLAAHGIQDRSTILIVLSLPGGGTYSE
ncbi:uncharacterized protein LOC129703169 [Leucoraja erinacea]|uniref:uncharacterized protein LOC129703169 n=1 Tax=Leucoraja erinaceus TaxID=7782 RepID=UPI0024547278|nr:uncharacterized protein LOC129703169 [Leucoraja erinacea]